MGKEEVTTSCATGKIIHANFCKVLELRLLVYIGCPNPMNLAT